MPIEVPGLTGVTWLTAGGDSGAGFTCAVHAGAVSCWGFNDHGQLGVGDKALRLAPAIVGLPAGVVRLRAGHNASTCAILADDTVSCWGANNWGQLGFDSAQADVVTPTPVPTVGAVDDLSLGCSHACSLTNDVVACWGANQAGQVGTGMMTPSVAAPFQVVLPDGAVELELGSNFTCARLADATVHCWGTDGSGHLGNGFPLADSAVPVSTGLIGATAVRGGGWLACGLTSTNGWCWGRNVGGAVGDRTLVDTNFLAPNVVAGLGPSSLLETNWKHSCARETTGAVKCWGTNEFGQLGDSTAFRPGMATLVAW